MVVEKGKFFLQAKLFEVPLLTLPAGVIGVITGILGGVDSFDSLPPLLFFFGKAAILVLLSRTTRTRIVPTYFASHLDLLLSSTLYVFLIFLFP